MKYRIEEKERFYIVGFKKTITLQFEGENHQLDDLVRKMTPEIAERLMAHCDMPPKGILNVSANFKDRTSEGSELDQYIGIAATKKFDESFDVLEVEPSTWAVFSACGKYPEALQQTWADIYAVWLQDSGYMLTGGPEILWNEGPDTSKDDYHSEIWIPVKRIEQLL